MARGGELLMPTDFHFLRPEWLLAALPLGLLVWRLRTVTHSGQAWARACDADLLAHLLVSGSRQRRYPLALLAGAWAIAVVSLAGPTWSRLEQPIYKGRYARVVVLDLSASMNANDLAPSRLARARFKALDILQRSRDGQTALIVYALDAHVVSPLTDDANTISAVMPALETDLMPAQGSRLDRALERAAELLEQAGASRGEVIAITDGVADLERARRAAATLMKRSIRVSVLGIGTEAGAPIPLSRGGFLKDADGAIVIPKLVPDRLARLAAAGGGRYATITTDDRDLQLLLEPLPTLTGEVDKQPGLQTDRWREDGVWLVLLLLPLGALAFRRGWLLGLALLVSAAPPPVDAVGWEELWSRPDQRAARRLAEGRAAEAAEQFVDPAWRATARYRAGDYARAAEAFGELNSADAHYNRANALARMGKLREAMAAYDQALSLQADHEDALHNKNLLEQLARQQIGESGEEDSAGPHGKGSVPELPSGGGERERESDRAQAGGEGPGEPTPQSTGPDAQTASSSLGDGPEPGSDPAAEEGRAGEPGAVTAKANRAEPPVAEEPAAGELGAQGRDAEAETERNGTPLTQEARQALAQWLRRIPDDPGGLMRRKFLLEHRRRQLDGNYERSSEPW